MSNSAGRTFRAWHARLEGFVTRPGEAPQRVVITEKGRPFGVFVLTPLQPGILKRDSGTVSITSRVSQGGRILSRTAEDAARELPNLPLEDALQLVHLYFERGSPKAEPAARRWLVRYLSEGTPSLRDVAKVTASLASARRAG